MVQFHQTISDIEEHKWHPYRPWCYWCKLVAILLGLGCATSERLCWCGWLMSR